MDSNPRVELVSESCLSNVYLQKYYKILSLAIFTFHTRERLFISDIPWILFVSNGYLSSCENGMVFTLGK